jgi:hypothetical protein
MRKHLILIGLLLILTLVGFNPAFGQGGKGEPSPAFITTAATQGPAGNQIYQVFVDDASGLYTARTGPGHPITNALGGPQNVLFNGAGGNPGTTYNTIRSYTTGTDYVQRGSVTSGFAIVNLGTYGSTMGIGLTGYRTTYVLPGPAGNSHPPSPDALTIVQDVNVVGGTYNDSRVEVVTYVTNNGWNNVSIGIRYEWDFQIANDDGPSFTPINPDGAALVTETLFSPVSFSYYRIQDNINPTPTFSVNGSATGPAAFNPTQPGLLEFVCWSSAVGQAFDYNIVPGRDCASGFGDTAVLYYYGANAQNAIVLPPGQSVRVAAYIFATAPTVNALPQANPDSASTPFNTPVTINVLANDIDLDDPLTVIAAGGASNGNVVINADNTVTYTPNTGFTGGDSFSYTISDGEATSATNVTVTVGDNPIRVCQPGDADYNPVADLKHADSFLIGPGFSSGQIVNLSATCAYNVGIASYSKPDDVIDNQVLFASNTGVVNPGATLALNVDVPTCAAQVDLFYGTVLTSLNGQRYGERLIDAEHINGQNYCQTPGTEPTPAPTETPTPTPEVTEPAPEVTPEAPVETPTAPEPIAGTGSQASQDEGESSVEE